MKFLLMMFIRLSGNHIAENAGKLDVIVIEVHHDFNYDGHADLCGQSG